MHWTSLFDPSPTTRHTGSRQYCSGPPSLASRLMHESQATIVALEDKSRISGIEDGWFAVILTRSHIETDSDCPRSEQSNCRLICTT